MSKTYTLNSTAVYPSQYTSFSYNWRSTHYDSSYAIIGKLDNNYKWVLYRFDTTMLASLRSKTITSITLEIYSKDTFPSGLYSLVLGYAYNGTGNCYRSNPDGSLTVSSGNIIGALDGSTSYTTITKSRNSTKLTYTLTLTGTELPGFGYMIGPDSSNSNTTVTLDTKSTKTAAVLTVVTNETDYNYTLTYNANGGSGAPSNLTGSNTQVNPSYTFTISSTVPTRAGYEFLGWSTSSSATTASYQPGGTITVTTGGTTTLYAVWKMLNTIRVVNSLGNLELYMVYSVDSNLALLARRVMVVNSGGTLDTYT